MGAWLDLLAASPRPPLWLDDTDYSGRLLAGGRIPWCDATALIAWRRQAVSLLKPSLGVLDVGRLAAAFAAASPALTAGVGRGPIDPLAALLASAPLRRHVAEVSKGLRLSLKMPLALVMPSPRAWPGLVYAGAFGASAPLGADQTDEASVYVADFLRSFGEAGVDALLLTDDPQTRPRDADEVGWYQSVLNVGRHYRWDVGLKTPEVPADDGGLDFLIAPTGARGVELGAPFWTMDAPVPAVAPGGFRYARIPQDTAPERVLAKLANLGAP